MIDIGVPSDSVVTKQRGELAIFNIEVSENTPAMVKWFFNGAPLSSSTDRRVEIANEHNEEFDYKKVWAQNLDASLHINSVTHDDIGFYQVEISNPVETVLLTYSLFVEDSLRKY